MRYLLALFTIVSVIGCSNLPLAVEPNDFSSLPTATSIPATATSLPTYTPLPTDTPLPTTTPTEVPPTTTPSPTPTPTFLETDLEPGQGREATQSEIERVESGVLWEHSPINRGWVARSPAGQRWGIFYNTSDGIEVGDWPIPDPNNPGQLMEINPGITDEMLDIGTQGTWQADDKTRIVIISHIVGGETIGDRHFGGTVYDARHDEELLPNTTVVVKTYSQGSFLSWYGNMSPATQDLYNYGSHYSDSPSLAGTSAVLGALIAGDSNTTTELYSKGQYFDQNFVIDSRLYIVLHGYLIHVRSNFAWQCFQAPGANYCK